MFKGWHLGLYGAPVFDEQFQAWVHGPVQYEVYNEYKNYRWNLISEPIEKPKFEPELIKHIHEVLQAYGGETGYMLEILTHQEWLWIEARDDLASDTLSQNIISIKTMKELSLSYSLCKLQKDIVENTIKKQLKYRGKNG